MLNFNLSTPDLAYDFILDVCKMTGQEFLKDFRIECHSDFEIFWKKHFSYFKTINPDKIRIYAFHITGSLDDCNSIKKHGILNLQSLLSSNSLFNQMLKKYGVQIDIDRKLLIYNNESYDINYEKYRNKCNLYGLDNYLKSIAHRIFYDYTVNGFLCNDNVFNYGTRIHLRPEFLLDLSNAFPKLCKLEEEWINNACSYKIDYYTYIYQLPRFTFDLDEYRNPPCKNWDYLFDNEKIIKWMLFYAICRMDNGLGETALYLKDSLSVPPNQIVSYTKLI